MTYKEIRGLEKSFWVTTVTIMIAVAIMITIMIAVAVFDQLSQIFDLFFQFNHFTLPPHHAFI
jgi:hypothetical protein